MGGERRTERETREEDVDDKEESTTCVASQIGNCGLRANSLGAGERRPTLVLYPHHTQPDSEVETLY